MCHYHQSVEQPGGQPVQRADEWEVAGTQRGLWCLKTGGGWRLEKQGHMGPCSISVRCNKEALHHHMLLM